MDFYEYFNVLTRDCRKERDFLSLYITITNGTTTTYIAHLNTNFRYPFDAVTIDVQLYHGVRLEPWNLPEAENEWMATEASLDNANESADWLKGYKRGRLQQLPWMKRWLSWIYCCGWERGNACAKIKVHITKLPLQQFNMFPWLVYVQLVDNLKCFYLSHWILVG